MCTAQRVLALLENNVLYKNHLVVVVVVVVVITILAASQCAPKRDISMVWCSGPDRSSEFTFRLKLQSV